MVLSRPGLPERAHLRNLYGRGDNPCRPTDAGKLLGTPLGSPEFVSRHMRELREEHDGLLNALRVMPELQSAWLLLSLCASARANYYLMQGLAA